MHNTLPLSNPIKAYSYLRFSTPEQMKGDSHRRQTALAQEYVTRHGLELDDKLTFHDLGVSAFRGKNAEAGRLGEFLEAVRAGLVERGSYLLVESLDRISRQAARKALRVLEQICEEGITVVTLSDGRTYTEESLDSDPMALMMSLLIFIRANEESAMKSKRMKASWEFKRSNATNKPITRTVPAWIKLDEASGKLVLIEERTALIRRIYQMYLDGVGLESISRTLNAEGIEPWGPKGRPARHWHHSYIMKVLNNPAVIGTLIPNRRYFMDGKEKHEPLDPIPNYYPAAIDQDTWLRVQELRNGKNSMRGRRITIGPLKNVFANLATCPCCDGSMIRTDKGKGSEYLVCSKAKAGAGCNYRTVRYANVEEALISQIGNLLLHCPADTDEADSLEEQLRNLEGAESAITDALENLLDSIQAGLRPTPAINQRIRELEQQLDEIRAEEQRISKQLAAMKMTVVDLKVGDLSIAMETQPLNRERVNSALRALFEKIVVNYRSGYLEFHWRHSAKTSELIFDGKTVFGLN